jgi:ribosome maturation protein SDO1
MTNVEDAVTAKLNVKGLNFEILVDCEKAMEFKQGKNIPLEDFVVTFEIFKDVKKGEKANEHEIKKLFGTDNKTEVIKKIIIDGVLQLTKEYKDKLREEKRRNVINLIHRYSINPTNNLPHPPARIEAAIEEARVKIDEFKKAEEQVKDIITKINSVLPIRYEIREVQIRIPAKSAGKCYSVLKQFGALLKDEWQNDGSLLAVLEIPAGLTTDLFDKLNSLTHGDVESKIINVK